MSETETPRPKLVKSLRIPTDLLCEFLSNPVPPGIVTEGFPRDAEIRGVRFEPFAQRLLLLIASREFTADGGDLEVRFTKTQPDPAARERAALAAALEAARQQLDNLRHPLASKLMDPSSILAEREKPLREALQKHHQWQLDIGKVIYAEDDLSDPTPVDLTAEYVDSTLYEQTVAALAGVPEARP